MSDAGLDELRREVAERRGLDAHAARFLTATSVAEIEGQADDLAELLGAHPESRGPERAEDALVRAFAHDARRRRAVVDVVIGSAPRRDARGRFARRATAGSCMDPGPRSSPPLPAPSHEEWLISVLRERRTIGLW